MKLHHMLPVVFLLVAPGQLFSQSPDAGNGAYNHFVQRNEWLLKEGGRWRAENPTFDSTQSESIRSFGYQFTKGYGPDVIRLKISGRAGSANYLYWDGFYYWHPLRNRVAYVAQGTGGAVATGESVDEQGTLVFEILRPDGIVETHRDEEVKLDDIRFQSTSFKYTANGWEKNQVLTWVRVRQDE